MSDQLIWSNVFYPDSPSRLVAARQCERVPDVDILTVLPLAFVMIAGPQIISAVFFATSESWGRSSAGYVLGAALSITLVVTVGFLLLGFFPSDLVTSISVGGHLSDNGDPWLDALPFIALTLLFLGSPGLLVVALGHRARTVLPKVRDWMNTNSWIVSEVVLAFFVVIILTG